VTPLAEEYRRRAALDTDIKVQMPVLYAWAHQAANIIELGVRGGNSSVSFLAGLERGGLDGTLWSVDIDHPQVPDWLGADGTWQMLVADDVSDRAVAFCPDGADILFIDTSHYYPHTLQELRLYVPKVRPGGIVLLHDSDPAEWPDVPKSLDEYCDETGLTWYNHPHWHGLGVIEIPA
jgi:predicted O-methyltransferase YrrM